MCATPYGENADVLHSDARVEVMKQYPVMVAAGNLKYNLPLPNGNVNGYRLSANHCQNMSIIGLIWKKANIGWRFITIHWRACLFQYGRRLEG